MPHAVDDALRSPAFAAAVDLLDAIRKDDAARTEIEKLVSYLIDEVSSNDAQASTLSALVDSLQVLSDDTNLAPFEQMLSLAVAPPLRNEQGAIVRHGLTDAALRALSRIFEKIPSADNACWDTRDPNRALPNVLARLVTPTGNQSPAPIEVMMDVIGDVNRADPSSTDKFDGGDYGNVANEMSVFLLDPSRGLEQLYTVIRQATAK
jgi:hypothetical protein